MITLKFARNFLHLTLVCGLMHLTGCKFIKNNKAEFLVPQGIIEHLSHSYFPDTMRLVNLDLRNIRETAFQGKIAPNTAPIYVATAGGPGACKSTILENYLQGKVNFVYVDPDQRALKYMINTYHQSVTNYEYSKKSCFDVQKNAYKKWRAASNYISHTILNEAFANGYNIAYRTTSTGESIAYGMAHTERSRVLSNFYQKLKQKNYKIVLLLCYAEDDTRAKAVEYRDKVQNFVQSNSADLFEKGKVFPTRFPIYFEYADEINLYWTDDFLQGSIHAATYERFKGLTVHNQDALTKFIKKYESDRTFWKDLPPFDALTKMII